MCKLNTFLSLIAIYISVVNSWDIAITTGDQIEFFANGTKTSEDNIRFKALTALAYDAVHNMLLFVAHTDNASIFSFHITNKKYQPLVRRSGSENIQGIAFDPVKGLLFWTDSNAKSIYWMSLSPGSSSSDYGKVLLHMDTEIPRGIAVDSCTGYIYWTNTNFTKPTIERARFDGSDRKVIVDKNIFMPVTLDVDQGTGRLYWADDRPGIHFSIESCDLDGNDRMIHYEGTQHSPNAISVSKEHIFWTDLAYKSVWKLSKTATERIEPVEIVHYNDNPFGIVANYDIDDLKIPECQGLVNLYHNKTAISENLKGVSRNEGLFCLHGEKVGDRLTCTCDLGYIGERCEVNLCQQFCLNGGCSISELGAPICKCMPGYSGERCQTNVCQSYCVNGGVCSLDSVNMPVCKCSKEYIGRRCEIAEVDSSISNKSLTTDSTLKSKPCNCSASEAETQMAANETLNKSIDSTKMEEMLIGTSDGIFVETGACETSWDGIRDPVIAVLGTFCALLSVICGLLLNKVMQLKKRPRIKKRIIVNKNVTPLTARPHQCEITIENCCNMNVCETPCFEPRSIRSSLMNSKPCKEEKTTLITSMERPDDY